jgi:predicted ATPase/class 3 adenylate cyclase
VATKTFLFTDIEGATTLLQRVGEDVYARALTEHHALIRSALAAHDGTELTMMGDGFFAVFSSPRACVAAVLAMQHALQSRSLPDAEPLQVRMGVHTGEAEQTAAGPVGLDVHRAARIAAVAHGGQVLLSETVAVLVRDSLPDGVTLTDLGAHRLKDLGGPQRIFQLTASGLRSEFPALRSLGNPALLNNLPAELSTFVGRAPELKKILSLVDSSRLVTLTGPGGSGKTRLGLQAAAEMLDETGDGVWLVELATVTDADSVPSAIAAVLGVAAQPGRPMLDTLVNALAPQRLLIVLDNCEHLVDACARAADAILRRCPRVHLLATSREPLGIGGEAIYPVPPLSLPAEDDSGFAPPELPDAVALFVDRAQQQGVSLTVDGSSGPLIASICRRLDGMPLAIELAAARLRSLSLADLRDRLHQRFRLLTGGSRAALARQQTLLATVAWSYSLLDEAEQRLLCRLAVFPESFDLSAAEAVCGVAGLAPPDVVDLLGSLVNKSLVGTEQGPENLRYRLLETIRQFAGERLVEADDAAAISAAHCEYFVSVAEQAGARLAGPEQGRSFAALDADRPNLWRAAEYAAGVPDGTSRLLRLAAVLRRYWITRPAGKDLADLIRPVLERPGARSDRRLFVGAAITVMEATLGPDLRAMLEFGERVVAEARQAGEPSLLIEALAVHCGQHYFAGVPEQGAAFGAEAVALARRTGDDVLLGSSITGYLLCLDMTDSGAAEHLYAEGIACTGRSGDRTTAHALHNNASVHALRAGDVAAARAHLVLAGQAGAEIGKRSHVVPVNMGWVLRQEHDPEAARATFQGGLRLSRRTGDSYGLAYCSLGLACVAGDLGNWHQSAGLHGAAQAFVGQAGGPWQDPEERYREDSIAAVRRRLGDAQFDEAYAQGLALSFDDAIALALSGARQAAA